MKIERAKRLGNAIKIKTVSFSPGNQTKEALEEINKYIVDNYPKLHSPEADYIEKFQVNNLSIVFRVNGTDAHAKNPYLLCAHMDVVPEGDREEWDHDPFLGLPFISEGGEVFVYGRGAIDDKDNVFGILEVLEYLVESGQRPRRTF